MAKISEYAKSELERMYKELTDDDLIEENRRKTQVKKMKKEKMMDTGIL